MDIADRIERRRNAPESQQLIRAYAALSPVTHVDEPSGRGPVLEQLLDHLDPVFDGRIPPNGYAHGPFGSGKSAVMTALFASLEQYASAQRSVIHTSTREPPDSTPRFVYVDIQGTTSEFEFYHDVLAGLVERSVPRYGIGTDELRSQLHGSLDNRSPGAVVAVDHVGEPNSIDAQQLLELFAGLPSKISWLAVGRAPPTETALTAYTDTSIRFDPYRQQALVDVLMARASEGLARQALGHDQARRIAEWANGNAHHALVALFVAANRADRAGRLRLLEADVTAAIDSVPEQSVSLGRVLALPANRQAVLRRLVELEPAERGSVAATTEAIIDDVELSAGTIERFLYELAEVGVVERVQLEDRSGKGRPPSRVDPRFPVEAFRRLYDLQEGSEN